MFAWELNVVQNIMKMGKNKSNDKWLDLATSYEKVVKNEFVNHLIKMESWQFKNNLEKLCHYAIFLALFLMAYTILSEYEIIVGDSKRWLKILPALTLMTGLLEICIFVKFKKYFASLISLITQLIVFLVLSLFFNVFCGRIEAAGFLSLVEFLLEVIILIYYIIIGIKIKRRYKDNSYLSIMFLISPVVMFICIPIDEYWISLTIETVYIIMLYSAIGKSIKDENPVSEFMNGNE